MTTRFKTTVAAGIAVLTLAAGAPLLIAQDQPQARRQGPGAGGPPPGGRGGPGMRGPGGPMGFAPGFRQLELSDDQQAQMKAIADSHRDEFKAAGIKVRTTRDGMRALLEGDSINESAIRAKSAEVASAEADVMILNAKVRQESMQVLTSEQLAKLKELRTGRESRSKERKPRGK